jgi:regulator of replication initiation timing
MTDNARCPGCDAPAIRQENERLTRALKEVQSVSRTLDEGRCAHIRRLQDQLAEMSRENLDGLRDANAALTDEVERLRNALEAAAPHLSAAKDAEIQRLRKEVDGCVKAECAKDDYNQELEQKLYAAKAEIKALKHDLDSYMEASSGLATENERLREALRLWRR